MTKFSRRWAEILLDKDWKTIISRIREGEKNLFITGLYQSIFSHFEHDGIDVTEQEWDYLIVLDACRYDFFEQFNFIEGDLKKVESKGSASKEWLVRNFTDYYYNTLYVTGNPFVTSYESSEGVLSFDSEEHFPIVENLAFGEEFMERKATSPEAINSNVLDLVKDYPDSEIIIHYMQPHCPLITDFVEDLHEKSDDPINISKLRDEGYSWSFIRAAYCDNMYYVLEKVEEILYELEGDVVITADHGELLGEWGIYAHPARVYFDELVEVPWLEVDMSAYSD
jgi:hypothetical protein